MLLCFILLNLIHYLILLFNMHLFCWLCNPGFKSLAVRFAKPSRPRKVPVSLSTSNTAIWAFSKAHETLSIERTLKLLDRGPIFSLDPETVALVALRWPLLTASASSGLVKGRFEWSAAGHHTSEEERACGRNLSSVTGIFRRSPEAKDDPGHYSCQGNFYHTLNIQHGDCGFKNAKHFLFGCSDPEDRRF